MKGFNLSRISGFGLLAGAIAFVAHVVLRSAITSGPDPTTFARDALWVPVNALGVVGATLVLLGLPGVYARMVGPASLSGLIGVLLLAAAWTFFGIFLSLYSVLVLPWLADRAPVLVAPSAPLPAAFVIAFVVGLLFWFVGAVLLSVPFLRRQAQPHWVGYALPASAIWMVVGNLSIAPRGPATNPAVNLLSNLGPVLLLAGIGYLGHRTWSEDAPA
jgi:hypothetical protein